MPHDLELSSDIGDEASDALSDRSAESDAEQAPAGAARPKLKLTLKKSVCRVCGKSGHVAGFVGAVYVDCPNRPCYLCKKEGHSTQSCPYRSRPAPVKSRTLADHPVLFMGLREAGLALHKGQTAARRVPKMKVYESALHMHQRRATVVEFHPESPDILISADKLGHMAVWNYARDEKSLIAVHEYMIYAMAFASARQHTVFTASADGTVQLSDLETHHAQVLYDLNPGGWVNHRLWRMFMSVEFSPRWGFVLAGDDTGMVHVLDPRQARQVSVVQLHKKDKVTCLSVNPVHDHLLLSTGNDHTMRLWDARRLDKSAQLALVNHPRVVNCAFFSPRTGTKIMSTCTDNRIRVWDNIWGDLHTPSRKIVHSQDFNRYLSPFKAVWDPKDPFERLIACGRYISDSYGGLALHPVDLLDAGTGQLLSELVDPVLPTICPLNAFHPTDDVIASASSRSVFVWRPVDLRAADAARVGPSGRARLPLGVAPVPGAGAASGPVSGAVAEGDDFVTHASPAAAFGKGDSEKSARKRSRTGDPRKPSGKAAAAGSGSGSGGGSAEGSTPARKSGSRRSTQLPVIKPTVVGRRTVPTPLNDFADVEGGATTAKKKVKAKAKKGSSSASASASGSGACSVAAPSALGMVQLSARIVPSQSSPDDVAGMESGATGVPAEDGGAPGSNRRVRRRRVAAEAASSSTRAMLRAEAAEARPDAAGAAGNSDSDFM